MSSHHPLCPATQLLKKNFISETDAYGICECMLIEDVEQDSGETAYAVGFEMGWETALKAVVEKITNLPHIPLSRSEFHVLSDAIESLSTKNVLAPKDDSRREGHDDLCPGYSARGRWREPDNCWKCRIIAAADASGYEHGKTGKEIASASIACWDHADHNADPDCWKCVLAGKAFDRGRARAEAQWQELADAEFGLKLGDAPRGFASDDGKFGFHA